MEIGIINFHKFPKPVRTLSHVLILLQPIRIMLSSKNIKEKNALRNQPYLIVQTSEQKYSAVVW